MSALAIVWVVVYWLLVIYFCAMWGRFVLEIVRSVNPGWRPNGLLLVLSEGVYTLTDPPVRFFRRLVPPIRIGQLMLDIAWSLAMVVVIIAMTMVSWLT